MNGRPAPPASAAWRPRYAPEHLADPAAEVTPGARTVRGLARRVAREPGDNHVVALVTALSAPEEADTPWGTLFPGLEAITGAPVTDHLSISFRRAVDDAHFASWRDLAAVTTSELLWASGFGRAELAELAQMAAVAWGAVSESAEARAAEDVAPEPEPQPRREDSVPAAALPPRSSDGCVLRGRRVPSAGRTSSDGLVHPGSIPARPVGNPR